MRGPCRLMLVGGVLVLAAACAAGEPDAGSTDGPGDVEGAARVVEGEVSSADGVTIRYEARGAGDPALVLVHGWTNDRGIWGEHLATLAQTHRVVALDLGGHGASAATRTDWTMDAFGEDVVAVTDQMELDGVVLVGFSMGGAVVLEAAERLDDRVRGVVFVDTFHDPDQGMSDAEVEQMIGAFRANWGDTTFLRAFAYSPDAPARLVQRLHERMPAEPREHWFTVIRSMPGWLESQFHETLAAIDAPVAAINTTRLPTDAEAIRRYAPSFSLDTLAGVGHAGILHRRVEDFDARLLAIVERFEREGR